jgi:hypothetical protein
MNLVSFNNTSNLTKIWHNKLREVEKMKIKIRCKYVEKGVIFLMVV